MRVTFMLHVVNAYINGWRLWSSCLFEQNLQLRLVVGCLNRCWWWAAREGAEREAQNRERGHFFGVSHYGERLGSNPAGLTALSRNVCDWRPGWGMHCAAPCASKAERPRDVICLMESVLVFLLHHGMCFYLQQWRPRSAALYFVYILTLVFCYSSARCVFVIVAVHHIPSLQALLCLQRANWNNIYKETF